MKQPKFWQPVYRMAPRNPTPKPQTPSPPDPHHPLSQPPPGRVLCTVLVTIPWAGPLSLIEFHSIDNKQTNNGLYYQTDPIKLSILFILKIITDGQNITAPWCISV